MNVASGKLCEKLYKLSNWDDVDDSQKRVDRNNVVIDVKYDLGYLIRKLPVKTILQHAAPDLWYASDHNGRKVYEAETPEDVLSKLAIVLFNQGVLTK